MIKVLQVLASLEGSGGVQKRLLDNYLNMSQEDVVFDFIVHGYDSSELEPVVKALGCNVYHVSRKRGFGLFKNIMDINTVIKNGEYDIVQSHMERAGAIVLPLSKLHNVKVRIAHSHLAHITSSGIIKLVKSCLSAVVNLTATDFWACSQEAGEWLFEKDRSDLRVIPNAIDVEKFKFRIEKREKMRRELFLQDAELAIVNVGRLSHQKNHKFLFDIMKQLVDLNINFKLFLVGDGELKNELMLHAKKLGLVEDIVFLGTRSDVYDLMQAMDLMIHPALFEGLGNVLIEAQAAGLPIVTSNEGIPKETKITDIIEYVSLEKSARDWAQVSLAQAGIGRRDTSSQVIEANYDCTIQGRNLEKLYKKLLEKRVNKYAKNS